MASMLLSGLRRRLRDNRAVPAHISPRVQLRPPALRLVERILPVGAREHLAVLAKDDGLYPRHPGVDTHERHDNLPRAVARSGTTSPALEPLGNELFGFEHYRRYLERRQRQFERVVDHL